MGAMGSGGKVELMQGAFRVLLRARELRFKKVELSKDVVVQAHAPLSVSLSKNSLFNLMDF